MDSIVPPARPFGYRFGAFELDLAAGELKRRGLTIRLRGRPIDILSLLIERRGEVVSREQLRAHLWPVDTFVDFDHGLNSAINKLREALGETAESPRFIETVPKRGYRFIASIEVIDGAPERPTAERRIPELAPAVAAATGPGPDQPGSAVLPGAGPPPVPATRIRPRAVLIGLVVATVLVGSLSAVLWRRSSAGAASHRAMLIVLPFENLSPIDRDDVFSDGFTDELIAQLGALDPGRLGVIARTTSMQYKRSRKDVMQIGRELGVDYLLEGSVRRDDRRARITVQLVEVGSQTQLWAESYERDLADVLMLQHDVAVRVSRTLAGGVLSPVLARAAEAQSPKFAAYELVLRGRAARQEATEAGNRACVAAFNEAIAADPDFAPAYSGLADCYRLLAAPGWEVAPPNDLLARARDAAEHALALDPTLPEGYTVRGMVRFTRDWDLAGADADLARALELNPSDARTLQYRSAVLLTAGRPDAAVQSARKAYELDPLSATEATTLGVRLYYAGRYPEAIAQFSRTLQAHPEFAVAHWGLGETYLQIGRFDAAISELRLAADRAGGSNYMRAWLAHALATAGHRDEAETIRRELTAAAETRYIAPFLFALMASGFGDRDLTFTWLERAFQVRSGWMPFVRVEPELAWLRTDPRFERLTARVRPSEPAAATR